MDVYSCSNENFVFVVAANTRADAIRAMAETQGFHGYDAQRAAEALDVYPHDDVWSDAAYGSPLTVYRADVPRYGMASGFSTLTLSIGTMAKMTYERAERAYRYGSLTASQWAAYGYVWRTSTPRFSETGAEHSERPTDPFVLTIVEAMEALAK